LSDVAIKAEIAARAEAVANKYELTTDLIIKSIEAAKAGIEQRDAFGRRMTETNKAEAEAKAHGLPKT